MAQLITWIKKITVSWGNRKINVRRSVDESQATHDHSPQPKLQGIESGQASEASNLPGKTSEATVDSAKPPVWYLDRATQCMERAHQMTSRSECTTVKQNRRQCNFLAEKLETAIKNSRESFDRSSSPEHKAECLETLKLLYRLAKEVESFVQDCCKHETWMQAALTSASVAVHVPSLVRDLKVCTELLRNSNKLGGAWLTVTKLEGLGEAELYSVKEMASNDEDTLLKTLKSKTPSNKSETTDVQLATIFLERSKAIQVMSNEGSPESWNLGAWKVDDGLLKRSEILGKGSRTTVYRAIWFGAVAVAEKVFSKPRHPYFEDEVPMLAQLSHPNIVTFLGYVADKSSCSAVMELMEGHLKVLIQQKMQEVSSRVAPFSISVACDIMLQVAEGVYYIHQKGVVHRNLKSSSILFKSSKDDDIEYVCAKVANFGLSKAKGSGYDSGATYPEYLRAERWMAPELQHPEGHDFDSFVESVAKSSFKSDAYSFAMLCIEILTGQISFSAIQSVEEVRKKVLAGHRPELPGQCPHDLKSLIELCWDAQPDARPSFAKICEELRYVKCSLLQETLGEDQEHPSILPIPTLNLLGEVSKFKGDYSSLKVVRQLGNGGSDNVTVYLATWRQPEGVEEEAAQKTFTGSYDECFVNEVSILADLKHPNIVRLLCYATNRRSCSIVMERMDADLHDMIRQRRSERNTTPTGPFSIDEVIAIMLQIAQAMDFVHQKKVVHRDLKSCNILVKYATERRQLVMKVADFGLSVRMDPSGPPFKASAVGTVRWMAPEVMRLEDDRNDEVSIDQFKSDVYSFGMVCYEILVGRVPFYDTENLREVKKKVLGEERPPLPKWTPPNIEALVEKCWQVQASNRPSFSEIIETLEAECAPWR